MADGAPQIWDISLTPAQRWALVQLAFSTEAPKVSDSSAGKKLRRALRAFGLMNIRDALKDHENKIAARAAVSTTPALFKITAENLDCVVGWAAVPRNTAIELEVGDVFDLLETIKADPIAYIAPVGVPPYDAATEDWKPEPDAEPGELTCPSCGQKFKADEISAAA